jgi:hypothetical protein
MSPSIRGCSITTVTTPGRGAPLCHGAAPALVNALNYVFLEWNYKPAGFVSYGGLSGGTRSVVMTKTILVGLKMVPILEAVNIPFYSKQMVDGVFNAGPAQESAAVTMRWTNWRAGLMPCRSCAREVGVAEIGAHSLRLSFGQRPPKAPIAPVRRGAAVRRLPVFLSSSMAEHPAVNRRVAGSSPA